jgi:hypothetical protein
VTVCYLLCNSAYLRPAAVNPVSGEPGLGFWHWEHLDRAARIVARQRAVCGIGWRFWPNEKAQPGKFVPIGTTLYAGLEIMITPSARQVPLTLLAGARVRRAQRRASGAT